MAETAKKAKKKKGKTIALTDFLANDGEKGPSPVSHAAVFSARSTNWADESENLNTEVDTSWPEESYGGVSTEHRRRAAMDRASLPTAPRAARGPDLADSSKIPEGPPYTAFLGNLSYDVDREDILEFFGNKKITEVRLPQDNNGRLKGFGYAEFEDKESLLEALSLNNENLKNRRMRVDVAGQQQQQQERERGDRGDRGDRSNEPDRTDSDWRSKPDPTPDENGFNDRDRYNDDGGSRDRWGPRGGYDSGPRDRSGYDGPPRERPGGYSSRNRGYDDGPPRGRDDRYGDRQGDDRHGDRDQGKGFGSGWDHGDKDRQDDRGYEREGGYGRDRSDNRRYGGDRYGGDRYGGDRGDRSGGGYGRDRYEDRRSGDRYGDNQGDRGGGFGRDRYDDRRYGDRERYDDRRGDDRRGGGDRYGDRDRRRDHDEHDRRDGDREQNSWRGVDRGRDARSDFDRDEREPVKERPKLQLQKRTKPVEEDKEKAMSGSSVFGGAKPVDTAAKEREIEEKLERQKLEDETKLKQEKEKQRERRERDEWPSRGSSGRARRDSNRSSDGERGPPRERRDSSDYRSRRDSARSSDEGTPGKDSDTPPRDSPREGAGKEAKEMPKEAPKEAPPPAVNVWAKRMEQQKAASVGADKGEPKSPTGELRVELNVDSSSLTVTSPTSPPTSPDRKGFFGKPGGPRKEFRDGGGPPKGRGRGRGERGERPSAHDQDRGGRGPVKKEKRERKPPEPKKYEEGQQPVFDAPSKFAALLADEDSTEQDTEQRDEETET